MYKIRIHNQASKKNWKSLTQKKDLELLTKLWNFLMILIQKHWTLRN